MCEIFRHPLLDFFDLSYIIKESRRRPRPRYFLKIQIRSDVTSYWTLPADPVFAKVLVKCYALPKLGEDKLKSSAKKKIFKMLTDPKWNK